MGLKLYIWGVVYLSVAVNIPCYKASQSGFEPDPVMCQTIDSVEVNNCPWTSCGESCLSKTTGTCSQILATVRRNGTDIQLNNCQRSKKTICKTPEPSASAYFNCTNRNECEKLFGTFDCTHGRCYNLTYDYECNIEGDGITLDLGKNNIYLTGYFQCNGNEIYVHKRVYLKLSPLRTKMYENQKSFKCDRRCQRITTLVSNVIIMVGDSVVTMGCDSVEALVEARGSEPGVRIPLTKIWEYDDTVTLLTSCSEVYYNREDDTVRANDCLNGTLVNYSSIPFPAMNFSQLWRIYEDSNTVLDPTQKFLPMQENLTIIDSARLYVNVEGCVDTLRDECADFQRNYGRDGGNNTAQSRYQCYFNKNDPSFVVPRLELAKTPETKVTNT